MRIVMEALGFGLGDHLGGSVRVAHANARALADAGHDVTFYCTNLLARGRDLYPRTTEMTIGGVRVVYLKTYGVPFWNGSFGPSLSPGIFGRFGRAIAEADVVHLFEYRSFLASAIAAEAHRRGVPFVLQPQGTLLSGGTSARIKRWYDWMFGRRLLERAAKLVALTAVEAQACVDAGVPRDRIAVVPIGMDIGRYASWPAPGVFRARIGAPVDRLLLLTVGRLDYVKGQDLLIEAFSRLPRGQAQLVIIGADHGLRPELERLIALHQLDGDVLLAGPLSDADVQAALVDCDVFVMPSRYECFGMAILEACCCSKPLVLTRTCQNAPAFDGRGAVVVEPEPDALARGLAHLVADPALRAELGRAGHAVLTGEFTQTQVTRRLETLYDQVIR